DATADVKRQKLPRERRGYRFSLPQKLILVRARDRSIHRFGSHFLRPLSEKQTRRLQGLRGPLPSGRLGEDFAESLGGLTFQVSENPRHQVVIQRGDLLCGIASARGSLPS